MKNFKIILITLFLLKTSFIFAQSNRLKKEEPLLSIALAANLQIQNSENSSIKRLQQFVHEINMINPDSVVILGNLIKDSEESLFSTIFQLSCLQVPFFAVAGNNDFQAFQSDPQKTYQALTMPSPNYIERRLDKNRTPWVLIFVDGNRISLNAWGKKSTEYKKALLFHKQKAPSKSLSTGAIGKEQLKWLILELKKATHEKENVIVFCHYPIYPENENTLWDSTDIINGIKRYPSLKAWISATNDNKKMIYQNGVLFLTIQKMMKNSKNSFALLNIYQNKIELKGKGTQPSFSQPIE